MCGYVTCKQNNYETDWSLFSPLISSFVVDWAQNTDWLTFLSSCLSAVWSALNLPSKEKGRSASPLIIIIIFITVTYCFTVPLGFLPWEIRAAIPGESQLRQSSTSKTTLHVGCFRVSMIYRTLTWTTGSWTWSFCMRIQTGPRFTVSIWLRA